jgi:hypothetical protein
MDWEGIGFTCAVVKTVLSLSANCTVLPIEKNGMGGACSSDGGGEGRV